MAATIEIHELTAAGTGVDKTSGTVRFKSVDSAAPDGTVDDINDPLLVPSGVDTYSYVKRLRPYMSAVPDTNISDLRWYTDGIDTFDGVSVQAKNIGTTWSAPYNTEMVDGTDLFDFVVGSPLDGDAVDTGPFVPGNNDSLIGDMIELQMTVTNAAPNGRTAQPQLTLAYSEI